jgi:hypothetical protein
MRTYQAIEGVEALAKRVDDKATILRNAAKLAAEQWKGLRNAGGAREDHAATLLGTLRSELDNLPEFCQVCSEQIAEIEADPFGDASANQGDRR